MEENQSEAKKEYELKKQERLQKREGLSKTAKRGNNSKKIFNWLIVIAILALLFWGFSLLVEKNTPKGDDFSESFPSSGREHIDIGTGGSLPPSTYSSNPPSSGPHYPNTAKTGFYDEAVEDQFIVHNLEHGDIWIAYHPRVSDEVKKQLENFADRFVIVSPRDNNPTDIALVAWTRIDAFNLEGGKLIDEGRVRDFILRYDDKGPEKVRGGGGHQATSF